MQAGGVGVEVDLGAAEGEVDGGGGYSGDRGKQAFDEPGAAGATHAFYGEGDGGGGGGGCVDATAGPGAGLVVVIGGAVTATPQQGRLHLRYAPCVQLGSVAGVGGGGALRVGVGAEVVPGGESGVGDGFDRDAAGVAAYLHLPARKHEGRRLDAERHAAMVAARWPPKFRGRKKFGAQEPLPVRNLARRLRQAFHQVTVVKTLPLQPLEPARVSIAKTAPSLWRFVDIGKWLHATAF